MGQGFALILPPAKRGLEKRPPPGTKVRFTGYYLACTGQRTGSQGSARWLVVQCNCGMCRVSDVVAVNEPSIHLDGEEDGARWRHINFHNLQIVGAAPRAEDDGDDLMPPTPRVVRRKR